MLETIKHNEQVLAIILRADYCNEGIEFFTPNDFSQQLGYMNRPVGYVIPAHSHNSVKREVYFTKEVLFIKSGKIRADFYDNEHNYSKSCIVRQGDFVLLVDGGHGFEMLEQSEIIEIKQGPWAGEADKTRFEAVDKAELKIVE